MLPLGLLSSNRGLSIMISEAHDVSYERIPRASHRLLLAPLLKDTWAGS